MQFIREQSARWNVPRSNVSSDDDGHAASIATNIAPLKDDDDKAVKPITKQTIEDQADKDGTSTAGGGDNEDTVHPNDTAAAAPSTTVPLQDRIASVSNFLQKRKSSIIRLGRDVSHQAQQQAAAAAAAYEQYQLNKQFEQDDPILQRTIQLIHEEHEKIKQQRQTTRAEIQEYHREQNEIKSRKNAIGRDLWLKEQYNKLNPLGLGEYKKLFLPEVDGAVNNKSDELHGDGDDSSVTSLVLEKEQVKLITAQAKLCWAQHNEWMTDRQMTMVRTFQQEMIDFMFHGMIPTLKKEAIQVEQQGKENIERMKQYKQQLEELYHQLVALQEQLLQEYRSKLTPEELEAIQQELAAEKLADTAADDDDDGDDDDDDDDGYDGAAETEEEEAVADDEAGKDPEVDGTDDPNQSEDSPPSQEASSLVAPGSRENQPVESGSSSTSHEKTEEKTQMRTESSETTIESTVETPAPTPTETPNQTSNKKTSSNGSKEDSGISSALQARIAERVRQREAQESNEKVRTSPGKTSSRSELLERARNARKQETASMNDSPVKATGRPIVTRRSSASSIDGVDNGAKKVPLTVAERVAARRNLAATTSSSARQLNSGSSHRPAGVTVAKSALSEERRAQIRNGLRAGNGTATR
ncbi:hypothetical protein IV203_030554 [Nitzschia inconspicua]|uniref:Uncharacterized protein n=1 Tax=Nitzschia inconspicua TaxID=303405 RepID=A0A9K3KBX2_9STRA|nr:hypothetical protein IV203_022890 [Nitzschia inconspicua]KAG7367811.1 hypothetical protein IV203_030554 [Nitzschia inconspicua]